MFPLDLLQELLSPRPGHGGIFHCVRPAGAAMPAGGRQPQVGQPSPAPSLILCCCICAVQTDGHEDQLGSRLVSDLLVSSNQWHCLPCVRPWLAGWRLSASPSWFSPSPTLFPEEDQSVEDQYLEAESMTVKAEGGHQRAAAPAGALQEAAAGPLLPGSGHHYLAVWTG